MHRLLVVALVCLEALASLGCGGSRADTPPVVTREPSEPAVSASSASAPGTAPPSEPVASPVASRAPHGAFVIGAFVIDALGREGHTVVVPFDPAASPRMVDVLLVQSDAPSVVTAFGRAEPVLSRRGMLPCADGCTRRCEQALHGHARVEIDPSSFERHPLDCGPCRPPARHDASVHDGDEADDVDDVEDGEDEEDEDGEDEEDEDGEDEDGEDEDGEDEDGEDEDGEDEDGEEDEDESECHTVDGAVASIVGGRAFLPLNDHDECDGWNIYSLDLATFALAENAWAPPSWPRARTECSVFEVAEWTYMERPFDSPSDPPCVREASARFDADDCGLCAEEPTHVVVTAWNGALHYIGGSLRGGANGGGPLWHAEVPLDAAHCPSANDPCGDPTPYRSVLGGAGARFWISTDGAGAIVIDHAPGQPSSRLRLFRRGESAAVRELAVPFAADEVIGVRVHQDASPILGVIDHGLADLHEETSCTTGVTRTASETLPRETPPRETLPRATPCEWGRRPGEDGTCETLPLDASDVGFEDPRHGSGWGQRCVLHLRAQALDAAEAACARGLAAADTGATRGALLYNLGRIAQARGDIEAARRAYERSLVERPGNEPTARALAALAAPAR